MPSSTLDLPAPVRPETTRMGDSDQPRMPWISAGSDVLEGAVAGQTRLSLAHEEQGGVGRTLFCRTAAERLEGGSYRLRGGKSVVVGGVEADSLIVSARLGGAPAEGAEGLALFLVPADAPGLERRAVPLQGGGEAAEIIRAGAHQALEELREQGDLDLQELSTNEPCVLKEQIRNLFLFSYARALRP